MEIVKLIKYLQCPYCNNSDLILRGSVIICEPCDITYDIVKGVPILLSKDKLNKQEKNQTKWFDDHYSKFSQEEYNLENWRQSMLKRIFEQNYKDKVTTYLDMGCGATGYTVIEGAKRNNWISFGTDISIEAMIRANNLAKKQGVSDKTAFIVCTAENLPFKPNTFDYISAISILEHLDQDSRAIENITNSLTPTGYIYICVPNTYRKMWPFLWPAYYYNDLKIGHKRHYSIEQLDEYFVKKHNCKKNKVFYNGHLIKFYQLFLEKVKLINNNTWWNIEKKDINNDSSGVQLNVIYQNNLKTKNSAIKKILLINPPLYFSKGIPKTLDVSVPPLGILLLASYIKKYSSKFDVEIIDVGIEGYGLNDIKEKIISANPFVIGISAMTPQLQGAVELARFIKENIKTEAKIFLGGPHISADPNFIERHRDIFDYAIMGEAEKTFLNSLEKLASNEEIPLIQRGEVINDLDDIPIPDKKLIKREKYMKVESMLFSRGCPFHCYYCSRPSISRKVRYRSVQNILTEIKQVYNYCEGNINFQDDTFTMIRDKVVEFCNGVKKEGLKLHWHCNTRIDLVDDELLGMMSKAGCEQINFGIESGNERVRQEIINKGSFKNERIYEVFEMCRKSKIKIACYFMIGHPTETKEELQETKRMILKSKIDVLGLSIPLPFPGSRLYDIAKNEGIIDEKIIDDFAEKKLGEGYSGVYPTYRSKDLPPEYVLREMKDINRKFYINFRTFWDKFKQDATSIKRLKSDAMDLISLIKRGASTRKPYVKKQLNTKG